MYPVEFQTQSDVNGRALCDSLMNEVKDMDSHILYAVVSIPIEMSRHLGLLCIMCYLVEVPLEPLFQTVPRSIVVSAVSNYHLVSLIPWGLDSVGGVSSRLPNPV